MHLHFIFIRAMLEATTASFIEAALRWICFRYQSGRFHLLMLVHDQPPYLVAVYDGEAAPSYLEGIPFTTIPDGRIVAAGTSAHFEDYVANDGQSYFQLFKCAQVGGSYFQPK
mmetsp:Transcript_9107/g.21680  ORF Transcript_9107/g.21680 Transcript_9107/m.21680 type:complete len:113 (+) Transcript_9107:46-384(+)